MKPMLLDDWDEAKVRFPVIAQPKIDGVRGLNMTGRLTGRSLKPFGNRYVTSFFSHSALIGCDGEFAAQKETHPDLCRVTTSALSTQAGEPYVLWWLFDFVTVDLKHWPYRDRLAALREHVLPRLQREVPHIHQHLRLIPYTTVDDLTQLKTLVSGWEDLGFEGGVICDPLGLHKQGRSTVREGGKLRIKNFVDAEAVVIGVTEGESNQNEATVNALGLTERSTHKAGMVANGMVGTLQCRLLADVVVGGIVVLQKDDEITVAAGKLTADERKLYFQRPELILRKVIKFKFFPKGIKEKLRFPTFQSFRDAADMGGE